MTARLAQKIPASFSFAPELARLDSWGWIETLSASQADLSTLSVLRSDERISLDFSLGGRRLSAVPARVITVEKDSDGFFRAEIEFTDEVLKRELSQAILRTLAASA